MGGSSKQTVGFKYFAGMQVAIGNILDQVVNVNPDKRGWIFTKQSEINRLKVGDISMPVNKPNLFGGDKQEGGWVGTIDIHTGQESGLRQNAYLAAQDSELVSSFPGLSHLVFRGNSLDRGFQLVSMSGMLKEVLYWVKRIHKKDDGTDQWYDPKSEIPNVLSGDGYKFDGVYNPFDIVARKVQKIDGEGDDYSISVHSGGGSSDLFPMGPVGISTTTDLHPSSAFASISMHMTPNYGFIRMQAKCDISSASSSIDYVSESDCLYLKYELVSQTSSVKTYAIDAVFRLIYTPIFGVVAVANGSIVDPDNPIQNILASRIYDFRFDGYASEWNTRQLIGDMNPINKIREIITDDTAMNKPEAMINDENFKAAADRIFDEALGVSGAFTEKSCKDAIDELLYHIEAGARLNRQTGKYEIVLFRDDLLDLDNAMLFNKSNIKSFSIEIANVDDVINSVNVNYYDRENIKDSSFSLDEIGSVMSSEVNAQTLDFPYFMNRRNAELVGNWKLKQLSTPTRKGTFTTGKYEARKINKYDVVKLTWANQNMNEVPVRIMKIGLGDGRDNTVTLDWVEVIPYSSTVFPTISVDPPTSVVLPPQPNQSIVFEMPYLEAVQRFGQTQVDAELANNPDLGYLVVATKKPQSNSINALLYTKIGTSYNQASIVDYCPVAILDQTIGYLDTSFAVKNVTSISQAEVGSLILCDQELMVYQNYDAGTKVLTVKRAALDTHPKPHVQDAVFYFYDAFNAFDPEQYVLGEHVEAKVLTTTPSGIQELVTAPALPLEIGARPIRPYPPANVKINNIYFIETLVVSNDVVVTWVDRNRLQQTGGSILGWTEGGVVKETGVTYSIELSSENVVLASASGITANTYTIDHSVLKPNKVHKLRLWSLRDGYKCYQVFEHSFFGEAVSLILTGTASKDKVVGSTVPTANITVVVDESLKANMRYDGSSISGKAQAGATITIEVKE